MAQAYPENLMAANKDTVDQIVQEICDLKNPIITEARREQLRGFIDTTINGDEAKAHLVINATLSEHKPGALVYVLTNVRLIKIDIGEVEIQSSSYPLDTVIGVERTLIDGDRAAVKVSFQNGSFGLRYASSNQKIKEFFQKVDQARSR